METTTVYRDEKAGELMGLARVRSITQDDSHTFCTPEQIESVCQELIVVTKEFYSTLGMSLRARLSFRDPIAPERYLGEPALWERAQTILLNVAKSNGLDHFITEGEAAFYGPKIDFMVKDALGREHQLATPQLDFVQPARFGLKYTDQKGVEQTPVMIHFALMGSIERFLSVYIEHCAGEFPLWLAPVQVVVAPISADQAGVAEELADKLYGHDVRVELTTESSSIGKRIHKAKDMKVPYVVVLGAKEVEEGTLTVEGRGGEKLSGIRAEDFLRRLLDEVKNKTR
jgi:threonyl-tRNA synthetase